MSIGSNLISSLPSVLYRVRSMGLIAKVVLLGAISVFITAFALVALAVWQSGQYHQLARSEVESLINADLDHITQGVYNLVRTENEAVQLQVNYNLNVARHLLIGAGGVSLCPETVAWKAVNQLTKDTETVELPKLCVGGQWLGKNRALSEITPIVDEVNDLVGETATIFQRMNDRGDMLRVATTVETAEGQRAIGTYIPAVNPDGTANAVVTVILNGDTYHGRAYVVNAWYLTAYEPLLDSQGNLVGMLYVGIQQKVVESRVRHAILNTRVGKTGYVYVLGGGGEDRGKYIISYKGERDGEDVWDSADSDDRPVIQEIINKTIVLKPGEMTTVRYRWRNLDESEPRWKIARLVYFAPWDWVIGTSVYEDELQTYHALLTNGRVRMTRIMGGVGVVIALIIGAAGFFIAWSITRPIRDMTVAVRKIAAGDLDHTIDVVSNDEIGVLAHTFNQMTGRLKSSMAELQQSEEKYRRIFENAIEGLFQTTLDGRIVNANPGLARILGYESPEDLMDTIVDVGQQLYVHPQDRDDLLATLERQGEVVDREVQYYRKNKDIIWISMSVRSQGDPDRSAAVIEGFLTDITARKKAEEALAESRHFLEEVINSVADPMFVRDRKYRWVLVNDAMCASVGRRREELLGATEFEVLPQRIAEIARTQDDLIFANGKVSISESSVTHADGELRTVIIKKNLYVDRSGEKFIVGLIRDITAQKSAEAERRELEARLSQAQKMEAIGTLAGGIAHDFNNILQPILGYSELIREELSPDSALHHYAEGIYNSSLRAKDLVTQILTFSRQAEHKSYPLRIHTILKEVFKLSRSAIPTNIILVQDIDEKCPPVLINPTQIHQVAMNLIVNGYHAVEQTGGTVSVRLKEVTLTEAMLGDLSLEPGGYVVLSVTDTGTGIDPAILEKIFEPYFTTKKHGKGTGLGLAVVYGIVKDHRGDIRVTSAPGEGTSVEIFLPASDANQGVTPATTENNFPTGSERVMLVDDEDVIVELEKLMLERLGYKVTTFSSSKVALDAFKAHTDAYDLVITDMSMPGMTGDQLIQEMRAVQPEVPVIICTGFSDKVGPQEAASIGVQAFLLKPIAISELAQKVRKVLDRS